MGDFSMCHLKSLRTGHGRYKRQDKPVRSDTQDRIKWMEGMSELINHLAHVKIQ